MISSPTKEIVAVAEMSRMCGLSRSRFYTLITEGVMPVPSRNPTTNRPFYNRQQQEQCLLVRRTNCGINGKPTLFYSQRPRPHVQTEKKRNGRIVQKPQPKTQEDSVIDDIRHGLEQLGLTDVSAKRIKDAIIQTHPDGHADTPTATLLMSVFKHLKDKGD